MPDYPEPPFGGWLEAAVEVAGIDTDVVADLFRQGCPGGVAVEPAFHPDPAGDGYLVDGDAPALVKGYLPAGPDALRLRRALQMALRLAPLQRPPRWRRARRLPEQAWRDAWKRYFRPRRVGRSLVVSPSWRRYRLRRGDTVIQIDPGRAFGTGQHPTTAMCLAAIEELLAPGVRVLDLGTGSGILAIAAAKLGAAGVLALDIDPLAVQAARQNAVANGVGHLIEAREGTLDEAGAPPGRFDLIAGNISGLAIERLAPALARALAPSGALVASGFLEESVEGIAAALRAAGLTVESVRQEGVWRAIVARRSQP
ncbi:MAG TPA: 50S ribosomal protein L11 methyltransferase [Dehalococcoidia bacterium]|nr:50S ribosomal protein L11 methyltransferase [Dehalococcoidia bacterium]